MPGFQDGDAHRAAFHYPNSVAVSPDGGFVFVSDAWNHRVRAVVLGSGVVTTVAGKVLRALFFFRSSLFFFCCFEVYWLVHSRAPSLSFGLSAEKKN